MARNQLSYVISTAHLAQRRYFEGPRPVVWQGKKRPTPGKTASKGAELNCLKPKPTVFNRTLSFWGLFSQTCKCWFQSTFSFFFKLLGYSQTCVQRPLSGPNNSGRCSEVIYVIKVPNETSKWRSWETDGGL